MATLRSRYTDSVNFFGNSTPQELVRQFGSPLYVYNEPMLRKRCRELLALSSHPGFRVYYSAKANANLSILRIVREEGLLADAMSPGELAFQQAAGFKTEDILYVCNNVSSREMKAAADAGVLMSLDSLSQVEQFGRVAPGKAVMVRVNPGIGAGHSKKVVTAGKETKFGVSAEFFPQLRDLLQRYSLRLAGLNQHIGSLFMEPDSFLAAAEWLLETATQFPGIEIIDFGGGFGIPYRKYEGEARLDMADLGAKFDGMLKSWSAANNYQGRFFLEPGRYTVAESGLVLGSVHAIKDNAGTRYVGTDIGFNVLARPMLYEAFHDIELYREGAEPSTDTLPQTVVGNICESGDILAAKRFLPVAREGDIIAMLDAGAYGFSMTSPYTQRLRPAEVLIDAKGDAQLIRRRETIQDLMRLFPEMAEQPRNESRDPDRCWEKPI